MRTNGKSQKRITVDGKDIGKVETFNYLGATSCKDGGGMKDLKNRLSKARGTYSTTYNNILSLHYNSKGTTYIIFTELIPTSPSLLVIGLHIMLLV